MLYQLVKLFFPTPREPTLLMKFSCPVSVYQDSKAIHIDTTLPPPPNQSKSAPHLDQSVWINRIKLRWQERIDNIESKNLFSTEAPWKAHTVDVLVHTETVDRIAL